MSEHQCIQAEKFEKVATFTGEVKTDIKAIKDDVNRLYEQNREKAKADGERNDTLMDKLNMLDKSIYGMKIKFGFIGILSGIVGSSVVKYLFESLGK